MPILLPTPEELSKGRVKFGTLLIRPLRKRNPEAYITTYQVNDGEYSYGRFDSKEQALSFARQLYRNKSDERIKEDAT
ncbi:hypothetical protein Xbed_03543 [Xenorhabdus beddingii]|uniref:Bacteriophage protein n=1 Tax=Xenorhabdus beddingii TaxID=40578 RepID=A0A1Y2SEC7_9GAMM|nr:hypothetical protein [Xenorhabdus beddingii]OTA15893.1 hypothetical protein Xbed_03543 [Xenorhabdus beddingii]